MLLAFHLALYVSITYGCVYIDTGCSGGGGSGDDDSDDNGLQVFLSCDESVTRSGSVGCTVSVTGEMDQGEPYSASDFQFDLTSSSGASSTDTGNDGNRWSGTATEIATISVSVTSESYHEKESIQVTVRDLGSFPALSAQAACYRGWPRALWGSLLLA